MCFSWSDRTATFGRRSACVVGRFDILESDYVFCFYNCNYQPTYECEAQLEGRDAQGA